MIKITVDQSVEDALQRAFPRPQGAAYRALAKYVSAVEAMINEAERWLQKSEQFRSNRLRANCWV